MITQKVLVSLAEEINDASANIKRFATESYEGIRVILYPHSYVDKVDVPEVWQGYPVKVERRE